MTAKVTKKRDGPNWRIAINGTPTELLAVFDRREREWDVWAGDHYLMTAGSAAELVRRVGILADALTPTEPGRHTGGIHARVAEKIELADTYAQDGAFHSAARLLGDAAAAMKAHAERLQPLGGFD